MIISYSEISKWDTCQRQYWYRFGMGLKPIEESAAISTGVKGHQLLQYFYTALQQGKTKEEALKLMHENAKKLLSREFMSDGSLLIALTLVDNYIKSRDFSNQTVIVENRFLLPLRKLDPGFAEKNYLNEVQIGFTPDVVFERPGNFLDVEDAKFVGRAWSKKKLNRFPQAKLYQIFLSAMGYNVSRTTLRFFNTTTGKIAEQNYVLRNEEKNTLIHDFVEGVKEVIEYRSMPLEVRATARRTMNYSACQFCAFEFPCTLEAEGKDATNTFKAEFVKSDYDYSS